MTDDYLPEHRRSSSKQQDTDYINLNQGNQSLKFLICNQELRTETVKILDYK